MASQQRWVELFQQVIGRNPSPEEFLQAKACGFDPKQIKTIADMAFSRPEVAESSAAEPVVYDAAEADEFSGNQTELLRHEEVLASSGTVDSPESIWIDKFTTFVGHEPSADEIRQGALADFALESITPFLRQEVSTPSDNLSEPPTIVAEDIDSTLQMPQAKPKMPKWKKRGIAFLTVVVLGMIGTFAYGSYYFSKEQVAKRYIAAVRSDFKESLTYEAWADTKKTISTKELAYLDKDHVAQNTDKGELIAGNKMQVVGREFGIFPKWAIMVTPVTLTVSSNTKGLTISTNDKEVFKTTGTADQKILKHLYPGTYDFSAIGDVSGQQINLSQTVMATKDTAVKMNVQYVSFSVSSNIKDGDLYVGTKKVGTLSDGEVEVSNLAVTEDAIVYVKKTFADKSSIASDNQIKVANIVNGERLELDTSTKVLDRDTADDLVTQAYYKLGSYADYHETPDGLTKIFKNGSENKFYTDVKTTIDDNTTGAKRRSADDVNFTDVDVTKVTQTGKNTYTVDFTVVYDFVYTSNSTFRSWGHIRQKLSWSCTISLKDSRDRSTSTYYDYEDYYITGTNGDSSVVSTEDTVS